MIGYMVFCVVLASVQAYPGGAPPQVCGSMQPGHGYFSQPRYTLRFKLEAEVNEFQAHMPFKVSIMPDYGAYGEEFKGFMIRAFDGMTHKPIAGLQSGSNTEMMQTRSCDDGLSYVTHTSRSPKSQVSAMFYPDDNTPQYIYFNATIVKNYTTLWTNVGSGYLMKMQTGPGPSTDAANAKLASGMLISILTMMVARSIFRF